MANVSAGRSALSFSVMWTLPSLFKLGRWVR